MCTTKEKSKEPHDWTCCHVVHSRPETGEVAQTLGGLHQKHGDRKVVGRHIQVQKVNDYQIIQCPPHLRSEGSVEHPHELAVVHIPTVMSARVRQAEKSTVTQVYTKKVLGKGTR